MAQEMTLMRNGNAKGFIEYLKSSGIPFQLKASNYTVTIKSDVFNKKFVTHMQSKRTFAAFSKIKSDVKNTPLPAININELSYFLHDFKEDIRLPLALNIDLRSAYATILFNDAFISVDTFLYLKKCKKKERLAAVGMLAARARVFEFINGEAVTDEEIISPYAPFFFYTVKRTFAIMSELKKIVGNDYLFTWVDGIYFKPSDAKKYFECCQYLDSIGFNYSSGMLQDFNVRVTPESTKVHFKKDGKVVPFNLPHATTAFKQILVDAILSTKQNKYEKGKIKGGTFKR